MPSAERMLRLMLSPIEFNNESYLLKKLTDNQRRWFGVCEYITSHWYYMLTPEEFAHLYSLRFHKIAGKQVEDRKSVV